MEEKNTKTFLSLSTVLFASIISIFGVLFLWRFFSNGIQALGINAGFFGLLVILFFLFVNKEKITKKAFFWLTPIFFIVLSFCLWANSFVGSISILILTPVFFIFAIHTTHKENRSTLWSRYIPLELLSAGLLTLRGCFLAPSRIILFKNKHPESLNNKASVIKEIVAGVIVLVVLAFFVIIPLLSSADDNFAQMFVYLMDYIRKILVVESMAKTLVAILVTIFLLGITIYWKEPSIKRANAEEKSPAKSTPDITIGIILSGVLVLYVLFIMVKINDMFIGELPTDFSYVERFVKTGFWQLFALTILNILFYIGVYKKTHRTVQGILFAFTVASLLLIFSAAQGVFKYVYTYGLSYEKFFAFYTVIFCSFVFLWFIGLFIFHKEAKINILKSLAFSALWMYAVATILPLESIIFKTNIALSSESSSRVNVNELKMLGSDALPVVEKNFDRLLTLAEEDHQMSIQKNLKSYGGLQETQNEDVKEMWVRWIENSRTEIDYFHGYARSQKEKKWYEKTVRELLYSPRLDEKALALPTIKVWVDSENGYKITHSTDLKTRYSSYGKELSIKGANDQTRLIIKTYSKDEEKIDKDEQNKKEKILVLMETLKKNNDPSFVLSEKSNLKAYVASYSEKDKPKARYSLFVETPTKIFQFDSSIYIEKLENIQSMTLDEFLGLTFENSKISELIKSFELVGIEK